VKIILAKILVLTVLLAAELRAGTVDTVQIPSRAMDTAFFCVVIKPADYERSKQCYPVVYLLHGYGGWYANWLEREPALTDYADQYRVLIVCPEGGKNSWYLDSPVDSAIRFETYIATEVPDFIDAHYRTLPYRRGRAITGLSMGGHGALLIAFRHSSRFGACGSMSGLMDLRATSQRYELALRLGDISRHADNWKNYSVISAVESHPHDSLAIIVDCGTDDPFFPLNRRWHEKMLSLKIPHDYVERPGKHDWTYWKNAVRYQLFYFADYFERMGKMN